MIDLYLVWVYLMIHKKGILTQYICVFLYSVPA